MARWLIKLEGDSSDLEEFPSSFPDGHVYAFSELECVYLTGIRFEQFSDASDVLQAARQVLDEFVAIILLLWPSLRVPTLGDVYYENDSGQRSRHLFASIHESVRAKDRVSVTVNGNSILPSGPTEAQILLAVSRRAPRAQTAMMIWADPSRTWPRLYRILEELEMELGATVSKVGLCTDDQRQRFNRSANAAEVAGKDSRHAGGKFALPKNPMSLHDATSFVGGLIQGTLRHVKLNP